MRARPVLRSRNHRGYSTVGAVLLLFLIASVAGVVLFGAPRRSAERVDENRAFFVAQGGANALVERLRSGSLRLDEPGRQVKVGSATGPLKLSEGTYWGTLRREDSLYIVTAYGQVGSVRKTIEVVLRRELEGVYQNAIFAGNRSDEPTYELQLGGLLTQADRILGDVYSGGALRVSGDAEVKGTVRAKRAVTGRGARAVETGARQGLPDLSAMAYESSSDVFVANEFATGEPIRASSPAGGEAWQLPESNPAHLFRKNPSDRTAEIQGTLKDDYFLEDPYEPLRGDNRADGGDAYPLTLSGVGGEPGPRTNGAVFFVDGNLWIHNHKTMSFRLPSDVAGLQVTFVVKGNLYVSDNLFYTDPEKDGVAFIAIRDPAVDDSGNIYFGDAKFGTLERMHAYLYAENDFFDVHLSATGSASGELVGNMAAGNQIQIRRDLPTLLSGRPVVQHSSLRVDFDERVARGRLVLPGLPWTAGAEEAGFEVLSWSEVELPLEARP